MYGMRRELARMREQVGGRSILLSDGSRYRYVRDEVPMELFAHAADSIRADYQRVPRPEPPEILRAIARARDRRAALAQIYPDWENGPRGLSLSAYDVGALVETGELVPVAFGPGFPPVVVGE
jgi:hypothetical protein